MCGRKLASWLAERKLFASTRELSARNALDWNLPLTKIEKVRVGIYMMLRDYGAGIFPPTGKTAQEAWQAERDRLETLPGTSYEEILDGERRKPFWNSRIFQHHAGNFARLWKILEEHQVNPPARLLELGCGPGWMSAWFAEAGYSVVGTDVADDELQLARQRVTNSEIFGRSEIRFEETPMESVDQASLGLFDAVYVYEALHHANDWGAALAAARRCLKENGILIIASEPNILHQFIAWRVARISDVREVGFSRRALLKQLQSAGFSQVRVYAPSRFNPLSFHWICARP